MTQIKAVCSASMSEEVEVTIKLNANIQTKK